MTCPICGNETKVVDSRRQVDFIYRRRKCIACGYTFTTSETEDEIARNIRNNTKMKNDGNLTEIYYKALTTISSLTVNYSGCKTNTAFKKLIDEISKIADNAIVENYKH